MLCRLTLVSDCLTGCLSALISAFVCRAGTCLNMQGCWRVSTPAGLDYMERRAKGRINPGERAPNQLAVSRAFGDLRYNNQITHVPQILLFAFARVAFLINVVDAPAVTGDIELKEPKRIVSVEPEVHGISCDYS